MSANQFMGQVVWGLYTQTHELNSTFLQQPVAFTDILQYALHPAILGILANITGTDPNLVNSTLTKYIEVAYYVEQLTTTSTEAPPSNASGNGTSQCILSPSKGAFTNYTLIPATFIILLFMFLNVQENKRKKCCCSWGCHRPGVCVPVNLVDNYENRFGFACAFGTTLGKLLNILILSDFADTFDEDVQALQKHPSNPSWTGILWKLLAMLIIGISHYPFFACMSTPYKLVGAVIGFVYSLMWMVVTVIWNVQCYRTHDSSNSILELAAQLPTFVCLIVLNIKYLVLIVQIAIRKSHVAVENYEELELKSEYKYKYVLKLLEPIPRSVRYGTLTFKEKLKAKMYKFEPEFKYSTRVVCTFFVGVTAIYVLIISSIQLSLLFRWLIVIVENSKMEIEATKWIMEFADYKSILRISITMHVSWCIALVLSTVCSLALVANMLSWYRGHLARLQRGERNFLPVQILSKTPSSITTAGLKYSGYQIAYMVWGFLMILLLLFAVLSVIGAQLVYPMIDGTFNSFLWEKLFKLWPTIIISLLFFLIQFFLAKYAFLYDRGQTLALNNRRLFHVATYFSFFFNVFLGIISCLQRIVIGAILGVLFLARTQKSLIPRDYELFDPGFNAYVGYLYLEHTHANPVLVTFCQLLVNAITNRHLDEDSCLHTISNTAQIAKGASSEPSKSEKFALSHRHLKQTRLRNRWFLLITLLNNPSLKEFRRPDKYQHKSVFTALNIMVKDNVGAFVDGTVYPLSSSSKTEVPVEEPENKCDTSKL